MALSAKGMPIMSWSNEELKNKLLDPEEINNQKLLQSMLSDCNDEELLQLFGRLGRDFLQKYLITRDFNCDTPLHTAAKNRRCRLIKQLLSSMDPEKKKDLLAVPNTFGDTIATICYSVNVHWDRISVESFCTPSIQQAVPRDNVPADVVQRSLLRYDDQSLKVLVAERTDSVSIENLVVKHEEVPLEQPKNLVKAPPTAPKLNGVVVKEGSDENTHSLKSLIRAGRDVTGFYYSSTLIGDLSKTSENGDTLLHYLCFKGKSVDLKQLLVAIKDDQQLLKLLLMKNSDNLSCFHLLFKSKNPDLLNSLVCRFSENLSLVLDVAFNADGDETDPNMLSPFGFALSENSKKANHNIEAFLEQVALRMKSSDSESAHKFQELENYQGRPEFQSLTLSQQQILLLNQFSSHYIIRYSTQTTTLAIIATNHFVDQTAKSGISMERTGSDKEAGELEMTLKRIGCRTRRIDNWTKATLLEKIKTEILKNKNEIVCLMVCLMSHGIYGSMIDTEQQRVNFHKILTEINRADGYFPKIMMCQCCQGIDNRSASTSGDAYQPDINNRPPSEQLPTSPHTCVMMSTGFGMESIRGIYFGHMCRMMSNNRDNISLEEMHSRACKKMMSNEDGEPVIKSQLTGKVYMPPFK